MANCSYCNSFILFGGARDETGVYCNGDCQGAGNLLAMSQQIPLEDVASLVASVYAGQCPRCGGAGPVDVHKAHKVWSILIMTSWSSSPAMSCKRCATKRQLGATVLSGVVGWWGLPWGLIMTPVQIIRNFTEMAGGPQKGKPSHLLERAVRIQAVASALEQQQLQQQQGGATPPPLPGS